MKVLVIGSKGQLGSDIIKAAKEEGIPTYAGPREVCDITDPLSIKRYLEKNPADAIINCAAFHDLALCEQSPEVAMSVNFHAVKSLSDICNELGMKFVHISTDYVFDGSKLEGYTELDQPNPINVYGKSKLAGEQIAIDANPRTFVVRVQSLYGANKPSGKGLNFVELMLKLGQERDELKVDQCHMAPTWTYPLARNLLKLLETEHYGMYHMSCNGSTSWYEFAKEIMRLSGNPIPVTPVPNDFFAKDFERPENTYLIKQNLEKVGLNQMPTWQEALEGYLSMRGNPNAFKN